ncbi:MAG: hypothetical protein CR979_01165 [Propionibacterium sp.]|nr:MAG: hypothetical protein CR979_01165 [Propionibacterium sp.]
MSVLVAAISALVAVLHAILVVPRLPEPAEEPLPDDPPKILYRDLITPRNMIWLVVGCFIFSFAITELPTAWWPLAVVYIGTGSVLAGIDLLTTYLPLRLNYLCLVEMVLASTVLFTVGPGAIIRAIAGAVLASAIFWLFWRFSRSLGFGDVRLAALVGFMGAAISWQHFMMSLLAGTLSGAVFGIAVAIFRKLTNQNQGIFPYGPSLWLGPIIAIAIS